jgi:hypothetical protein
MLRDYTAVPTLVVLLGFLTTSPPIYNPDHHTSVLATIGAAELAGILMLAFVIGAWSGCFVGHRSFTPGRWLAIFLCTLCWGASASALLAIHIFENLAIDTSLTIGLSIAWTFVIGYAHIDPVVMPVTERFDTLLTNFGKRIAQIATLSTSQPSNGGTSVTPQSHAFTTPAVAPDAVSQGGALVIPLTSFPAKMQLKLRRSQRTNFTGKIIFTLDARMEVPREECELIERYRLGNRVIYDSADRKAYNEAMQAHVKAMQQDHGYAFNARGQLLGAGKALFRLARVGVTATMAHLSLRITVYSLIKGVHVECDSMEELLEAEIAIDQAGQNLRNFLDHAATFDGREEIREF